jgi:hypothetical protein
MDIHDFIDIFLGISAISDLTQNLEVPAKRRFAIGEQ